MDEGISHWSSMVLRESQTCFSDRYTHPNSMYSKFCHVLKQIPNIKISQHCFSAIKALSQCLDYLIPNFALSSSFGMLPYNIL